jgi:hypothetical protein
MPLLPFNVLNKVLMATSQGGKDATSQTSQSCCCRHNDHNSSPPPAKVGVHNADDVQIWKTVQGFYKEGFLGLVIARKPLFEKLAAILRRWRNQPERRSKEEIFGYRINFADMQRMHLRTLQAKLINLGMGIQFDVDKGVGRGAVETLGPTLRNYSKHNPTLGVLYLGNHASH